MFDRNKETIQEYTSRARAEAAKAAKAAGTTVAQYWNNRWTASEDIYEDMLDSQSDIQESGLYEEKERLYRDSNGNILVNTIMFDDGSLFLDIYDGEENDVRTSYHQPFGTLAEAKKWLDEERKATAVKA